MLPLEVLHLEERGAGCELVGLDVTLATRATTPTNARPAVAELGVGALPSSPGSIHVRACAHQRFEQDRNHTGHKRDVKLLARS